MGDQEVDDPQDICKPVPTTYGYGLLNTVFDISIKKEIGYSMTLIMQAYNYISG